MANDFERVNEFERGKDVLQELVESASHRVGSVVSIITGAITGITQEIGGFISDGFEMFEASQRAKADTDFRTVDSTSTESDRDELTE